MKNAILLCSGGIDSVVTAHYIKNKLNYKKLIILFFNYEQKTLDAERKFSKKCAKKINAKFIEMPLKWLGDISNSLINKHGKVHKLKKADLKNTKKESGNWYVPCRNTLFLIYALALAESIYVKEKTLSEIFIGFKCEGKESYPDTTKEFVNEMNELSKLSCIGKPQIIAPLINKDKEDIINLGNKLGVNFKQTHSCYISNKHCGYCLACMLRKAGFYWAGIKDNTEYSR